MIVFETITTSSASRASRFVAPLLLMICPLLGQHMYCPVMEARRRSGQLDLAPSLPTTPTQMI
jgi:hypothetical protein